MKKVIIFVVSMILIVITVFACLKMFVINKKTVLEEVKKNDIHLTDINIQGRVKLEKDNSILIGNSIKELENDFYEIKILNTKGEVIVYMNKLWYESYGDDYIQDEYLAEICRQIVTNINIRVDSEQLEYTIYKYIKDNYMNVRYGENIKEITTEVMTLKLELENSIVKLVIRGI